MSRFQLVWWPRAWALWRGGPQPNRPGKPEHGRIYRWRIQIGPLEIRRFGK
jgi:hypothetical protein